MPAEGNAFDEPPSPRRPSRLRRNLSAAGDVDRPYWRPPGGGELLLQHCAHCGTWQLLTTRVALHPRAYEVPEWAVSERPGRGQHVHRPIPAERARPRSRLGPVTCRHDRLAVGRAA